MPLVRVFVVPSTTPNRSIEAAGYRLVEFVGEPGPVCWYSCQTCINPGPASIVPSRTSKPEACMPKLFQFSASDVNVEKRETVFQGFFRMDKLWLTHPRFDGRTMPGFTRELFVRGDATCVLPYDSDRDEVVLLEQFRAGALGRQQSPWLLELVAGMNEEGESPEEVAQREGQEEAGLSFSRLERICDYLVSPGGTTEMVHLYCGQVSTAGAGGVFGVEDEHEDILSHVVSAEQCFAMISDGRINNAAAIIAIQWLQLHRERLRREWRV